MDTLTKILAEYGLGKPDIANENQLRKILRKVFVRYEVADNLADYQLEEEVLRKVLCAGAGVVVADAQRFKNKLQKEGIKIQATDWEISALYLEVVNYERHSQIEFRLREWDMEKILVEQMRTHPDRMKKEDLKFCLAYAFDRQKAIKEKINASLEKLDPWVQELNENYLTYQLHEKLTKELWEKYQQVRVLED